jgi:CubicO group peptidase (beta-lactamase class C family)
VQHNTLRTLLAVACLTLAPFAALAQTTAPSGKPATAPVSTQPSNEALTAKIDAIAAQALSVPGAAGLSIAVSRGDTVILSKGYGKADLEHDVPATADTLFRIASVTKQYTAAAIMKLAEQGKLSLDDDITTYVDFPTQGRKVTIRHLLNHTSGIKSYTDVPGFFENGGALKDLTPAQILDPVRELPFDFEPGEKHLYNNSGYILLGMIIEKVSGKPYAQHLQDEFFTPLKLTHTRYDTDSEIIPHRARGYGMENNRPVNAPHISMTIPYAAGGLLSTAGDLIAWQRALVSGRVVSPESYQQMTTPTTLNDASKVNYGFGLQIAPDLHGRQAILHGGGIHGFNSTLAYFIDDQLSIAVISNTHAVPAGQVAHEIARFALSATDASLKDLDLPAAEIEALIGTYRLEDIKMDLTVSIAGGKVMVQGTGQPSVPVMAQGGRVFRASWDKTMTLTFDAPSDASKGKSPSLTLQQRGGTFKGTRAP